LLLSNVSSYSRVGAGRAVRVVVRLGPVVAQRPGHVRAEGVNGVTSTLHQRLDSQVVARIEIPTSKSTTGEEYPHVDGRTATRVRLVRGQVLSLFPSIARYEDAERLGVRGVARCAQARNHPERGWEGGDVTALCEVVDPRLGEERSVRVVFVAVVQMATQNPSVVREDKGKEAEERKAHTEPSSWTCLRRR
jgi:hypothetical protein